MGRPALPGLAGEVPIVTAITLSWSRQISFVQIDLEQEGSLFFFQIQEYLHTYNDSCWEWDPSQNTKYLCFTSALYIQPKGNLWNILNNLVHETQF